MRYPDATSFPGMILWAASVTGPQVPPGTYKVRMTVGDVPVATQSVQDPSRSAHQGDGRRLAGAVALALQIRDRFSEANDAVTDIRRIKAALADRKAKMPAAQQGEFAALSGAFATAISEVEDSLYQTQNRSGEDPLNFPIRLNNRIGALLGVVQSLGRPSDASSRTRSTRSCRRELTETLTKLKRADGRESAEDQRDAARGGARGDSGEARACGVIGSGGLVRSSDQRRPGGRKSD